MGVVYNFLVILDPLLYFLFQGVAFDKDLLLQGLDGPISLEYFLFKVLYTILP